MFMFLLGKILRSLVSVMFPGAFVFTKVVEELQGLAWLLENGLSQLTLATTDVPAILQFDSWACVLGPQTRVYL